MHLKLLLLAPIVLLALLHTPIAIAQITPATDGTGTTVVTQGNQLDITGGTRSIDGANLFHSFQQFGLNPGQVANFLSTPGTQNILGRVIGGQTSLINGPIQITGGLSHLYLLNPAGIVFGANASLNVPGSFTATTANGIRFSDQWWGIATHPAQFSSLTGTPTGFGFGDNAAGAIFNAGQLRSSQGIALLGGQVINTGTLTVPGGNITIAAVQGAQFVRISQTGSLLSLELPTTDRAVLSQPIIAQSLPELLTGHTTNPNQTGNAKITGTVNVDANDIGNGGNITVWADRQARISGTISANSGTRSGNGGWIETSGKQQLDLTGSHITTRATNGIPGTWLLDPTDIDIVAGGSGTFGSPGLFDPATTGLPSQIDSALIEGAIDGGTNVVITTNSGSGGLGDIRLQSSINQTGASTASLTLTGRQFIVQNASTINLASTGGLTLNLNAINPEAIAPTSSIQAAIDAIGTTNGSRTINLGAGIYAGSTLAIDRNLTLNGSANTQTLLSGENLRPVVNVSPSVTATITNLTIQNGRATSPIDGGGITNAGSLSLNTVNVQQNRSTSAGGGIANTPTGILTINNSAITNNSATANGGGISNNGQATIIATNFTSNNTIGNGGGIYANSGSNTQIQTTTFDSNTAQQGGGIYLFPNSTATIAQSNITQNISQSIGGGIATYGTVDLNQSSITNNIANTHGGGLFNGGNLTATQVGFTSNFAAQDGGGLYSLNQLQASDLVFTNNQATTGGGLFNSGIATVDRSTFSLNRASSTGGGIHLGAPSTPSQLTLTNSELRANVADMGGGIHSDGSLQLTNVTLSANQATTGGAAQINTGNATIDSSTIANNTATTQSGGIHNIAGNIAIQNTIVARNSAPTRPDTGGTFIDRGHNLIGISDGSTGFTTSTLVGTTATPIDPLLAPLANSGGITQTHALLPGSVALNAGNTAAPATDQRGIARVGAADIGAFESRGFTVTATSGTPQTTEINTTFPQPLTVRVTSAAGEPVDGGQVTFSPPGGGAGVVNTATIVSIVAGQASLPAQANVNPGRYAVSATAAGIAAPETFDLTNTLTPAVLTPTVPPPVPPATPIVPPTTAPLIPADPLTPATTINPHPPIAARFARDQCDRRGISGQLTQRMRDWQRRHCQLQVQPIAK